MDEPEIILERVVCNLCGAGDAKELFRSGSPPLPLVQCARCGLVYLNPRPDASSIARFYPPTYYGEGANKFRPWIELLRRYTRRRMADSIVRRLPRGARVLDYGCGHGQTLRLLQSRGCEGWGIERTEQAAAAARRIGGIHVLAGPDASRTLPDGLFDLVLFLHVLEHLPDPLSALREAGRLLKPHGRVLIAAPNIRSFQAIFGRRRWFHLESPRHLYHFSPDTLRSALEAAGFQVLHTEHFSYDQNPFGALQTGLNVLGFPYNHLYETLKASSERRSRVSPLEALAAALLAYPALVLSTLGSLYQRGATVTVSAAKADTTTEQLRVTIAVDGHSAVAAPGRSSRPS